MTTTRHFYCSFFLLCSTTQYSNDKHACKIQYFLSCRVVHLNYCGASVGDDEITDLVFTDDAVIFAESMEVLVVALEALHEEANPWGFGFGILLDETVQSVHACGEDIEIDASCWELLGTGKKLHCMVTRKV